MRRVFILFVAFLTSFLCLDYLTGTIVKPFLMKVPDAGNNFSNLKQSLIDREADILVLGASKANHHYIVDSLERHYQMPVCNAGIDGDNIVTSLVQFNALTQKRQPKIVIIDLSPGQMADEWEPFFLTHKCFYRVEPHYTLTINNNLKLSERLKLLSSLYRYNEVLLEVIQSYETGETNSKGFIPLYGTNDQLFHKKKNYQSGQYAFGQYQEQCLDAIVNKCKEIGCSVYIVNSPTLITYTNGVCESFNDYCVKRNVPFVNYEGDTAFVNHPELFKDFNHLNLEGAKLFTRNFINLIDRLENE